MLKCSILITTCMYANTNLPDITATITRLCNFLAIATSASICFLLSSFVIGATLFSIHGTMEPSPCLHTTLFVCSFSPQFAHSIPTSPPFGNATNPQLKHTMACPMPFVCFPSGPSFSIRLNRSTHSCRVVKCGRIICKFPKSSATLCKLPGKFLSPISSAFLSTLKFA